MSALSSYLAQHYLSATTPSSHDRDPERPKKRRKKDKAAAEQSTLIIADDDLQISNSSTREAGEEEGPMMYEGQAKSVEFRRKKASGWREVAGAAGMGAGEDEADRILMDAAEAEEERRRAVEVEDAPAVVVGEDAEAGLRMESGVKAGLQTAADTERMAEEEERERRAEEKRLRKQRKTEVVEETIYRDASGRRIDVDAKRVEARRREREEEERKKREKEEAMGDMQRRSKEEKKQEVEEAKFLTLARGEDDEEMNDRLKEVVRWDDPMAGYMARKQREEGGGRENGSAEALIASGTKKGGKVYQGHAPPNRYGIAPGWRWDGVDRGNSFEKEWFQARSKKARNQDLSYQWQEDE